MSVPNISGNSSSDAANSGNVSPPLSIRLIENVSSGLSNFSGLIIESSSSVEIPNSATNSLKTVLDAVRKS